MDYGTGVCPCCRAEFKKLSPIQIYCSRRCGERARTNIGQCIHNEGINCCGTRKCDTCAWNPGSGVSEDRLAIYLAGGSE